MNPIVSLFSGIGGLELGLEAAGFGPVKVQAERSAFCRQVLAKHWPESKRFDDVQMVKGSELPQDCMIAAGFPCQDASLLNAYGEGIHGKKTGQFDEILRILDEAVSSGVRVRWLIMENVSAILARGMDRVLAELHARGFDVQWDCVPASAVGAPHIRDRWFGVAYPAGTPIGPIFQGSRRQLDEMRKTHRALVWSMADATSQRLEGQPQARPATKAAHRRSAGQGAALSGVGGVDDGFSGRLDRPRLQWERVDRLSDSKPDRKARIQALGNAVVPHVAWFVGQCLSNAIKAAGPAWTPCHCGEYWCHLHEVHVFECSCPSADQWEPYSPRM